LILATGFGFPGEPKAKRDHNQHGDHTQDKTEVIMKYQDRQRDGQEQDEEDRPHRQ
jgi:hypothetical protein